MKLRKEDRCNNNNVDIKNYLPAIFHTWDDETLAPKIHLSSPKDDKKFRSHADNIDPAFFLEFLNKTKKTNRDFDVMIEAKNKDMALFNLMKDIKAISKVNFSDVSSIEF